MQLLRRVRPTVRLRVVGSVFWWLIAELTSIVFMGACFALQTAGYPPVVFVETVLPFRFDLYAAGLGLVLGALPELRYRLIIFFVLALPLGVAFIMYTRVVVSG